MHTHTYIYLHIHSCTVYTCKMCAVIHAQLYVCILECGIQQADSIDESDVAPKLATYKMHEATLDFTIENIDGTFAKYKAMIGDA